MVVYGRVTSRLEVVLAAPQAMIMPMVFPVGLALTLTLQAAAAAAVQAVLGILLQVHSVAMGA
jgi:phage tail protein X